MRWRLIDTILACEAGVSATGMKTFSAQEEFFQDHFPGMPIVPGVLQVEMMAQMIGKCAAMSRPDILPVIGTIKSAKFFHNINPEDKCIIQAKIDKLAKSYIIGSASIEVDAKVVSTATILFGLLPRSRLVSNDFDSVTQEFLSKIELQKKE